MNEVSIVSRPKAPISAETHTGGVVQIGGGNSGEGFRLPISNTASLTVLYTQHRIERPTSVTVTNSFGNIILVNTRIDPQTGAVSFSANKPITGFLLID